MSPKVRSGHGVMSDLGPLSLRWTLVGTACFAAVGTAFYCSAILLPKALLDQGAA
jgi:hypothetical protein